MEVEGRSGGVDVGNYVGNYQVDVGRKGVQNLTDQFREIGVDPFKTERIWDPLAVMQERACSWQGLATGKAWHLGT